MTDPLDLQAPSGDDVRALVTAIADEVRVKLGDDALAELLETNADAIERSYRLAKDERPVLDVRTDTYPLI
jgi:predicted ArsR family transcriptional regulator